LRHWSYIAGLTKLPRLPKLGRVQNPRMNRNNPIIHEKIAEEVFVSIKNVRLVYIMNVAGLLREAKQSIDDRKFEGLG